MSDVLHLKSLMLVRDLLDTRGTDVSELEREIARLRKGLTRTGSAPCGLQRLSDLPAAA